MEQRIADFLVHVDKTLAPEEQCQLEDYVRQQPCVVGAGISVNHPHLMVVAYDSDCGRASDIVHSIQDEGYQAEAIGF
jgi:hypothetical protein